MNNLLSTFTIDFLHTTGLFILCFFAVAIGKALIFLIKILAPAKRHSAPEPKQTKPARKPRVKKPIRSIEIDPFEIDRIYVKKS